ncbi:MAG: 2-amino-4-hydroxy-6-hydroxymethyldihydropteridine diphosphokinase [Syntrophales bacterium]
MSGNLRSVIAFVGIGSNLGEPVRNCLAAVERLSEVEKTEILERSSLYRTEPVGIRAQNWFVNCAVEIRTRHDPDQLLNSLQEIERDMGRAREIRWGPRIIDLDILFYGQEIIRTGRLTVPHPELHKRRFVLVPLNEIASYLIHPVFGISIKGLLDRLLDHKEVVKIDTN